MNRIGMHGTEAVIDIVYAAVGFCNQTGIVPETVDHIVNITLRFPERLAVVQRLTFREDGFLRLYFIGDGI